MTISAKIVADSIAGKTRLTTLVLRYPRFIHSELMTYRVFSRNASSSRAIPVAKMIQSVIDDPAMPVFWGKNQPGMQADVEVSPTEKLASEKEWLAARDAAVTHARNLLALGLHKQIANRVLEPWMHIEVVLTATDFENFLVQRTDKDAQPEIRELAFAVLKALNESQPKALKAGGWHLPFIKPEDEGSIEDLVKISTARSARVSYLNHEGKTTTKEEDLALYARLLERTIKHPSPAEHQAVVEDVSKNIWYKQSNLRWPWLQHRKTIENEDASVLWDWSVDNTKPGDV